jgi:iron(III) transport system ATP-binding protein
LEALDKVGLLGFSDRPAPKLSGGQQQRVALARAIAGSPKSLLLDEPLSNLDAKLREEMRIEIRKLQGRLGITALYVTHDQTEALSMSDQIAIMKGGKIVESGSPRDIYLHPKSDFAASFIGLMNVISGKRLDTVSSNGTVLQVPFGVLHCPLNENAAAGQELLVMVRPENVKVLAEAPCAEKNVWPGRLIERTFMGESVDCRIAVKGFTLRARIDPHGELQEGHQVFVYIDPTRCVTLAAHRS